MAISEKLRLFSGNANRNLAESIAHYLEINLSKLYVGRFADGEAEVRIEENVRGKDCFLIQPTCPPVNENVMELLIIIDALRRASVRRITAVVPYYGYARQDRKAEPRVPISAKLVANLLHAAGVNRLLTMDLHAGQIQGFFDIPVDNLYATPIFLDYLRKKKVTDAVVVSPDAGGVERARGFAKRLDADLAIIDKRRPKANVAEILNIIGEVNQRVCIVLDDIVDTAGTLVKVAAALKKGGAREVFAACTHGVLSGEAVKKVAQSELTELIITDTIPLPQEKRISKISVLSTAALFGEAVRRIHQDESVSALFV